jgi:hypothetical protein
MRTFTISVPGGRIGHFLAGAAVASVIGGTAVAITDTDFTYSTPKVGVYSIDPSDLRPANDHGANAFFTYLNALTFTGGDDYECFTTGLHFPQGARLLAVTSYYTSARTNFHTSVALYRSRLELNKVDVLISHPILDNSNERNSVRDVVRTQDDLNLIRNDLYSYSYRFCLSDHPTGWGDNFTGARISYRYSSAGD